MLRCGAGRARRGDPRGEGPWSLNGIYHGQTEMILLAVAVVASGLFAGAAIYTNLVEHPARLSCGTPFAVREFAPSYRRATIQQASLAVVGCAWQRCSSGGPSPWLH